MEYCTNCGTARVEGARFCGNCGRAFADDPAPTAAPTPPADTPAGDDTPFGSEMTLVAILVTAFAPFIALIIALVMRSNEVRPRRRSFLKTWAIWSAAWLCTGWVIVFFAIMSISSSGSGCQGGIDRSFPPAFSSSDNVHWTATYSCVNGGTKTIAYHGQVP